MINKVRLENFGPLQDLNWTNLSGINLVIGGNGKGKTCLLKSLYCSQRTLEDYQRGDDPRTAVQILVDKLYWTYQVDKIGELVTKGESDLLSCAVEYNKKKFYYSFSKHANKEVKHVENEVGSLNSSSIFLPAKEVLSLQQVILDSREKDKVFGFDETYLDLARAIRRSSVQGRNYAAFADARKSLEKILGGKIVFDEISKRWQFRNDSKQRFPIGVTAEGVKKIAILDSLLSNRYLTPESVVFIDELESALHPKAISQLLEIVVNLSIIGIQFFIASHSYYVIKKLYIFARKNNIPVSVLSLDDDKCNQYNLLEGMPANSIIDEAISLYKEEVGLVL